VFVIELAGLQAVVKLAITSGDLPPGAPLCLKTSSVGNCRASPGRQTHHEQEPATRRPVTPPY
jgi:hypothetical protein